MLPKATLLDIGITIATPEEMVEHIGRGIRDHGPARTVAAVNVHTFIEARRSTRYREALNDAAIAFIDGVPIRWLLKAGRIPPPPRIHGADLMTLLLERLGQARHLFFGSTPGTLGLLADRINARFPALQTAGFISPPFRKEAGLEPPEMIERINAANADVLWVALGAPKQELWAMLNRHALRVPVIVCVGAAFEILAGRFTRAPLWLQHLGLEWAWRLCQDPGRLWRRYISTNGAFAALLLRTSILGRGGAQRE